MTSAANEPKVFFGYGSLVNAGTYPEQISLSPARLRGFRRVWGHQTETRVGAILSLSVHEAPDMLIENNAEIEGVLFAPRDAEEQTWLDQRESGYEKLALETHALHAPDAENEALFTYRSLSTPDGEAKILQSYVDAVMQGFLHIFGEEGAWRFVETTDGWDAPLLDDRNDPVYPRAVRLASDERALIDSLLANKR